MKIGGLVRQSLIDWEGRITAVLFMRGCNFRCGYCHNPSLVLPALFPQAPDIPEAGILAFLESRKEWLEGVVVSGGEPTLQHDLPAFIEKINMLGISVKLDTNGTNPGMLKKLIDGKKIEAVAMDIKAGLSLSAYRKINAATTSAQLDNILTSVSLIRNSQIERQFRMTVMPGVHTSGEILAVKKMFTGENFKIQEFREGDTVKNYL